MLKDIKHTFMIITIIYYIDKIGWYTTLLDRIILLIINNFFLYFFLICYEYAKIVDGVN